MIFALQQNSLAYQVDNLIRSLTVLVAVLPEVVAVAGLVGVVLFVRIVQEVDVQV